MTGVTEARAALERGRRVVLVAPPAPEQAAAVWQLLGLGSRAVEPAPGGLIPGRRPGVSAPDTVILTADRATALDWAAAAPPGIPLHPVTGLARAARLLKEGGVEILAGSHADLAQLVSRAALKPETIATVVVGWPEAFIPGSGREALDAFLGAASDARRVILSWNPPGLRDFLERHAFKAPIIGDLPLDDTARPLPPVGPARYAIVSPAGRGDAIRGALDVLDPRRAHVWDPSGDEGRGTGDGLTWGAGIPGGPVDLVVCATVPTREQFGALAARGPVVLLLTPSQLGYARFLAAPLTALRLPGAAERAADAAEALRRRVAARLEAGEVDAELLALEPLFAQFDPAEVAAALLALQREPGAGSREPAGSVSPAGSWVKLFVNVGKKDRAGPKDLVGALIKEVGIQKADLGRIEVRDTFSTVEVAAGVAEDVVRKLAGVTIRGRRVQARRDRDR